MTKTIIKKQLAILLGVLWICIALNFFLLPHSIASAGVGSIGYLVETGWQIDRHLIVWTINLVMLALTYFLLEPQVFVNTLIGSLSFPILLVLLPELMLVRFYGFSLVLGSFFFSLGVYSLYRINASNGGITIPPLILEKYYHIRKAKGIFLTNAVIILLNLVIFSWNEALVSALSIYLIAFFMRCLLKVEKKRKRKASQRISKMNNTKVSSLE
ncbi:YitT family protein [Enterococcus hermanniensis]|uniref:Transporter n=1 Tax=Enterococcus hermanniensis TaxID=249189 RepID=A0A1L8TRH8_9ENTE|nr:YitT family protein [Enterococcus hermanniensis]OJG46926.1 transporter [Enterococcus hermanniensis]